MFYNETPINILVIIYAIDSPNKKRLNGGIFIFAFSVSSLNHSSDVKNIFLTTFSIDKMNIMNNILFIINNNILLVSFSCFRDICPNFLGLRFYIL